MPPRTKREAAPPVLTGSSHDRILKAAKHLFAERGYENTSTVAIARLAGTSESQLMKHFGSKEGLLEAIFEQGWDNLSFFYRGVEELSTPLEKIQALLDLTLKAFERDHELKELLLLEGRRIRKEGHMVMMTGGFLRFVKVIDGILHQMRAAGQLRSDLPVEAARSALIGMLEGLLRDQLLARRMGFPAKYSHDDLRRIFALALAAFTPGR